MNPNILFWLQKWYKQYCNGDWEHDQNIVIKTVDNPGWRVTINLVSTSCENKVFNMIKYENGDNDWIHCFVRDCKFEGAGDPEKLINILNTFKNWVENDESL